MADTTLKRWNSDTSQWEELNPQTTHTQIVASGTPSATTYLRGDGSWQTISAGSTFTGGTVSGNIEISNTLPKVILTDTNNNSDFHIANNNGTLEIADTTNQLSRVSVTSNGDVILPSGGGLTLVDKAITNSNSALLWDGDEIYHEGHLPTLAELGAAASSHTHTIANVTGLQTALDGKAASSHTHTFASLTSKPTTLAGFGITDAYPSNNPSGFQTSAQVASSISALVDSAPGTLNTLNELAAALGDDPNFATTVTNSIATKLPLAGGTMTGPLNLSQNPVGTTYGQGASANPTNMIFQTTGDNDGWRLYGEAPATNDVKMIFEVVDDNEAGDTWVFRNKRTYAPYTATEDFKITGEGHAIARGNLTSNQGLLDLGGYPLQVSGGNLLWDSEEVWHSGNFNPGSYLTTSGKAADSNLLDGVDSSGFVQTTNNSSLNSDTRNTRGVTRVYRRDDNSDFSIQHNWTGSHWHIRGYNGDTFHAEARVGYSDSSGNADTVDGYHASQTAGAANTAVVRNGSGYIMNNWFNSNRGDETSAAASYIYDTGDGYMRKKTLANARSEIVTSSAVTGALGYTPYNSSNPSGYTTYSANQAVNTTSGPTFAEVYNNGWFRNNQTGEGMYNTTSGMHFYSNGGGNWTIRGGEGAMAIQFMTENANTRGYVYADNGNNIGFLTAAGGWRFRIDNSGVLQEGTVPWSRLSSIPSTFTPSSHTHDDRYYTEGEVNTLLAGKQAAGTYNTIIGTDTDLDTSGATIIDNIYVTDGVITSMGTRVLQASDINALQTASAPYYSPVANSLLVYNTTYGWLTQTVGYWQTLRSRTDTASLTSTGCTGTTGGSISAGVTLAQGDTIMMEVADASPVSAGYTTNLVTFTLGAADTTPNSILQGVSYRSAYSTSTTSYMYHFKVGFNGSTLYFDDSFRVTLLDTSTATNILANTNALLHIGRIWRLNQA